MHDSPVPPSREQSAESAAPHPRFANSPLPDLLLTLCFSGLAIALLAAIMMLGGNISLALKDPATLTGRPVYLGAVSNAGVMFLVIGSTSTMMAAAAEAKGRHFLLTVSPFTALLAADDLFLLHEGPIRDVLPWFEIFMFTSYFLVALAILWMMRCTLFRPRQMPILLSLLCMGLSVIVDLLFVGGGVVQGGVEDLFKFAGFLLWSIYWSRRSLETVRARKEP